jgi:hypothetical protein
MKTARTGHPLLDPPYAGRYRYDPKGSRTGVPVPCTGTESSRTGTYRSDLPREEAIMTPDEREARWREPFLDAVALVRASITYDREAQRVLLAHGEPDLVRDWLLTFAKGWLLGWAGQREVGTEAAAEAALDYLDRLSADYHEDAA